MNPNTGFTFVHAADLHLDSPFKGLSSVSPEVAGLLRGAVYRSFDALINLCMDSGASFLLLAGDIFDWQDRSLRAQLKFRDGLARLADKGIATYLVHGNHDPVLRQRSPFAWPRSVHIFPSDRVETLWYDAGAGFARPVAISGISHSGVGEKRNLVRLFHPLEEKCFHIGLVHANVGTDTGHEPYAPCTTEDLKAPGVDYWALGHVHTRRICSRDPFAAYPGNIQGLSIRETGPRGCYLVKVDPDGEIRADFVELDQVRWSAGSVDIGNARDIDALEKLITEEALKLRKEASGKPLICRIRLVGSGSVYQEFRDADALQTILERQRDFLASSRPLVWIKDIILECQPEIDLEARRRTEDLLGHVLQFAHEIETSEGGFEALVKEAIYPLFRNRRIQKAVEEPQDRDLREILSRARVLLASLFEGSGR